MYLFYEHHLWNWDQQPNTIDREDKKLGVQCKRKIKRMVIEEKNAVWTIRKEAQGWTNMENHEEHTLHKRLVYFELMLSNKRWTGTARTMNELKLINSINVGKQPYKSISNLYACPMRWNINNFERTANVGVLISLLWTKETDINIKTKIYTAIVELILVYGQTLLKLLYLYFLVQGEIPYNRNMESVEISSWEERTEYLGHNIYKMKRLENV